VRASSSGNFFAAIMPSTISRRHRSRCITQDVMLAPTTFAWTKPVVAPARRCRLECFGLDVRIKQPHGRFEMRQIGAMLIHLTLKTFDRVRDFQSLISQGRDNQCAHCGSPRRIMPSEEHSGPSPAPGEAAGGGCYRRPDIFEQGMVEVRYVISDTQNLVADLRSPTQTT
jgi:hypothetical protein